MTAGRPVGIAGGRGRRRRPPTPARRVGLPPVAADAHLRARPERLPPGRPRPVRPGVPPPAGACRRSGRSPATSWCAATSGGDLCVQACADDPQVAFHAVRDLARIARGAAVMRWTQLGFGRASSTSQTQATPRNLQGFKDGTNNLEAADAGADAPVRVGRAATSRSAWMRGGTLRRHAPDPHADREVGRLGARRPAGHDRPRQALRRAARGARRARPGRTSTPRTPDGKLVIPADAHIRRASHVTNGGVRILRRGLHLHRRHRPGHRRARRRPLLHLLPARPARPVRGAAAPARGRATR